MTVDKFDQTGASTETSDELLLKQQEMATHQQSASMPVVAGGEVPTVTLWGDVWHRLRRNKLAIIGLGIIITMVLIAILAPLVATYPYDRQNLDISKIGPSSKHWFGTDTLGRDYFSRVIYGSRISVAIGFLTLAIFLAIGLPLGAIAGYFGGWADALIMRLADVMFAYPFIVGAIVVIQAVGEGVPRVYALAIAIGFFAWAGIARLFRSSILQAKSAEYVEAARALGASHARVLVRHVIPNSLAPVIVFAAISTGGVILTEAALSFLGIGVQAGIPTWGLLVSEGKSHLTTEPWLVVFPGMAIVLTVLGFILLGDGLRDSMDPRLR